VKEDAEQKFAASIPFRSNRRPEERSSRHKDRRRQREDDIKSDSEDDEEKQRQGVRSTFDRDRATDEVERDGVDATNKNKPRRNAGDDSDEEAQKDGTANLQQQRVCYMANHRIHLQRK